MAGGNSHIHRAPTCPPHHANCSVSCDAEGYRGETIVCKEFRDELAGWCSCTHWPPVNRRALQIAKEGARRKPARKKKRKASRRKASPRSAK